MVLDLVPLRRHCHAPGQGLALSVVVLHHEQTPRHE